MPAKSKLEGRVFSRLTVIKEGKRHLNKRMWDCLCSCGKEFTTRGDSLLDGRVRSCGCLRSESIRTQPPIGELFGRLTVLGDGKRRNDRLYWKVSCSCGTVKDVRPDGLLSGLVVSCGCHKREQHTTHGLSKIPGYVSFRGMNRRCSDVNDISYPNYGGRGIGIIEEWDTERGGTVETFLADMGPCPEGYSLERLDLDKGYSPDNCIWADRITQAANKRRMRNNSSGRTGVGWCGKIEKWRAILTRDGKIHRLGDYSKFEDAVKAREVAELKYFGFIKK